METETSRVQKLLNFQEHEIVYLKGRVAELEAALRGLIEAHENQWHPMKINGAEWFTARAALAGEKNDG